ncbi:MULTISPECIES: COG3650 family protein [Fischerella]|jgi:uncharacterized membrane protein|uniref:Uncharacterized protein n=4 Tax=Fischerella TaxID=1190 RepID=G6FTP4_9CYAN|nr:MULTISPECIES: hypothetical protein [Fischerella]PLZ95781.1 hypothetical protein CI592_21905 [Fischerella thermalis CCMEE 5328]PMB04381.1 hypothetical protein CEN49_20920 [Fischerella thermalis CCMEE 5273]RDH48744.1 hypothetical protein CBF18_18365 [Mastigocladus laminosus WC112]EHC13977.1 hypothetical protein FJSC11DRAFT_2241 [Fischerella thermalis JSC-11]MBF1988061.1 hypothetical protein [Fischerella thermalis M58_A2018_009]
MKKILIFSIIAFVVCSSAITVASQLHSNNILAQNTTNTEEFIARGTEPFWSVTVSKKNGIVYSTPENRKLTFPYVTPLQASGRPKDLLRVYRLRGKTNNTLIIKKEDACSDGMSDIQYPYSATLILGNTVLEGCAERK